MPLKAMYCMFPLIWHSGKGNLLYRDGGQQSLQRLTVQKGTDGIFQGNETILYLYYCDVYITVGNCQNSQNCTIKLFTLCKFFKCSPEYIYIFIINFWERGKGKSEGDKERQRERCERER